MKALVQSNPEIRAGRAVVRGRGVLTAVLLDRWMAGETVEEIAKDHGMTERQITAGLLLVRIDDQLSGGEA